MKTRINFVLMLSFLLLAGVSAIFAQDIKDSLKVQMRDRYPALSKLKLDKKVGETYLGFVEVIKPEYAKVDSINKVVTSENADREMLYKIIAKEAKTTAEVVGKNNALRIFQKAEDQEYFKGKDDQWRQKKDIKEE